MFITKDWRKICDDLGLNLELVWKLVEIRNTSFNIMLPRVQLLCLIDFEKAFFTMKYDIILLILYNQRMTLNINIYSATFIGTKKRQNRLAVDSPGLNEGTARLHPISCSV